MNIMNVCIFHILILTFFLSGCGAITHHKNSINQWGKEIKLAREGYEELYLGKSKNVLLNKFGEPSVINYNVGLHGNLYEEQWYYNFSKSLFKGLNSQPTKAVWFYMNNEIIGDIDVW